MGICDRAWKYYFTRSLKDNDEGEAPVGEEDGKEGLNESDKKNFAVSTNSGFFHKKASPCRMAA